MIDLKAILVANGAAVVLLQILLLSTRRALRHRFLDDRLFHIMVGSVMLQCMVETATYFVDGNTAPGMQTLSLLLNSTLFINNIIFVFLWPLYADFKLFGDIKRLKRIYPFVAIPAMLVILGGVVNLFVPVFFRITPENIYERTGLYFFPYLCTYFYLAYGVVLIYRYRNKVHKYLFLPAIIFMIPILLGSVLQYFFYGLSLIWIGAAIALCSLYVNVQNEVSYTDPLSGLLTRQYMNHYLDSETRRGFSGKKIAGIMLDIDQFKLINDKFGHLMGDDAIRFTGKILRRSVPPDSVAVRFAGDEFMVILQVESETEVEDAIRAIRKNTDAFNSLGQKPYELRFSVGYSLYGQPGDSIDAFLGRIDAAMYADKKARIAASEIPERRGARAAGLPRGN
ncbi:MAG: GGDEF domain-containing protein [Oscillospiraceae bacterium]|nr:GGDEF domain-containing protein [Oscillospiraceae bacterium]